MLASSLDAVVTIDATGRVLTFNPAAEQTFGYTSVEACGRDIATLIIPPSLRYRHYPGAGPTPRIGRADDPRSARGADGHALGWQRFPVELTVTRVPLDGPPVFTAYLRDITERKHADNELRASRARVIESGDRERRRIERNLHDGAQQRLVAVRLLLWRLGMEAARRRR